MRYHLSASAPAIASSPTRSLLRDLSDGLAQQMIFWGHDVRHPLGNRLVHFGMGRIERTYAQGEGSSRYRMDWKGGFIELHGFCAGWYPHTAKKEGFIFIRNRGRIQSTSGGDAHTPGAYDDARIGHLVPDRLIGCVIPFVSWWIAYEEWIRKTTPASYRQSCWLDAKHLGKPKSWLPPGEALRWLRQFVADPKRTGRARPKSGRNFAFAPSTRPPLAFQ